MLGKKRKIFSLSDLPPSWEFSYLGTCILKGGILCYRYVLSPLLGPACRFYPSCSSYALAAIEKYGALKGVGLALVRLAKCHPWHPGGIDPLR